jgi:hypothetical protein
MSLFSGGLRTALKPIKVRILSNGSNFALQQQQTFFGFPYWSVMTRWDIHPITGQASKLPAKFDTITDAQEHLAALKASRQSLVWDVTDTVEI